MQVLITGHSRGLGAALTAGHLARGDTVFGISRGELPAQARLHQQRCDLAISEGIAPALEGLCGSDGRIDLVYLNAGVLGRIADLPDTALADIEHVMTINAWANKRIIDWFAGHRRLPGRIIAISSGAAVVGQHGWASYCLSKAALNMLMQLYALELPDCHLLALAPGLVDSSMQAELREVDATRYPSVARLHKAYGTPDMPSATATAARIIALLPRLETQASGSYVDLRKL